MERQLCYHLSTGLSVLASVALPSPPQEPWYPHQGNKDSAIPVGGLVGVREGPG